MIIADVPPDRAPAARAVPEAGDAGAAAVFSRRQRLGLLAGFALLVMLRLPRAWLQGRFVGEEGTIFLAYAWHRPWADALWRSFGGYLNLAANGSTLLTARLVRAGVLPLEQAPYLTMTIALMFQLLPAILILTGRGRWLAHRGAVAGALLLIAIAPKTEEVFFNILHIQFHLALCAGLILALGIPRGKAVRTGHGALLFLAPLCGPGAIILWPFFALRALADRDRGRLIQTAVFGAGVGLQMAFFFVPSPVRGQMLDPASLAAVLFVRVAAMPVMVWKPSLLARLINDSYVGDDLGWWFAAAGALLYFGLLVALALRDRRDAAAWLIVPGLAVGAVSFGGGMIDATSREWFTVSSGERYNFLPVILVGLGVLALARRRAGRRGWPGIALFGLILVAGGASYASPIGSMARGPVWRDEVAAWRRDHDHPLVTWPDEWRVDLSDRDRPCSPPTATGTFADPLYCESHWVAHVRRAQAIAKARR